MRYEDFLVRIATVEGGYEVRVLRSPAGEGGAPFHPPFTPDPRAAPALLGSAVWRGRHLSVDSAEGKEGAGTDPLRIGEELFRSLFAGEVLGLYERSLDLLGGDAQAGLRIKISLDSRDPAFASLQALPWELLRRPGTREYLGLSRRQPIVRHLSVPHSLLAAPRPRRLRLLLVAASPSHPDLPRLDLDAERSQLREALAGSDAVEIFEPETPTLAGLRQALLRHECHVLHFMGHGDFLGTSGVLYFEAPDGGPDAIRGEDLIQKLADFPSLRLVVLNACKSAAAGEREDVGLDAFAGVAQALVLGGLPAVVAMRVPVTDAAAVAFSRTLYERLATGDPIDAAVAEGRQKIHSTNRESFEWSTPVVFLRTPDGNLFPERDVPEEEESRGRRQSPFRLAAALAGVLLTIGALLFGMASWFNQRGIDHLQHNRLEEARAAFRKALFLVRWSAAVHTNLAEVAIQSGDTELAREHYLSAIRWPGSRSAESWYNLGHFLNDRGEYESARRALEKARKIAPDRAKILHELGRACHKLGLFPEARRYLQDALALAPEDGALRLRLGEVALAEEDLIEAVDHLLASRQLPMDERSRDEVTILLIDVFERQGNRQAICDEIRSGCENILIDCDDLGQRWRCFDFER